MLGRAIQWRIFGHPLLPLQGGNMQDKINIIHSAKWWVLRVIFERWVVQIILLQVMGTLGNGWLGTCPFNGCQTKWTCRHLVMSTWMSKSSLTDKHSTFTFSKTFIEPSRSSQVLSDKKFLGSTHRDDWPVPSDSFNFTNNWKSVWLTHKTWLCGNSFTPIQILGTRPRQR